MTVSPARPSIIPLRPDPHALVDATIRSLGRAFYAKALMELGRSYSIVDVAQKSWPEDRTVQVLLKAASPPFTVSDATTLAHVSVHLVTALAGASAGAALLSRGLQLSFDGAPSITVPGLTMAAPGFVAEGQPIPAVPGTSSAGMSLSPRKFAAMWSLTSEVVDGSNAEQIIRQTMLESTAAALDSALFSNTAGSSSRPPGLLNNITPLVATAGGGMSALIGDIKQLVSAVAAVGGAGIVLVAHPA